MIKDDIMRMAREAGFDEWTGTDDVHFLAVIERFATLVAQSEHDTLQAKVETMERQEPAAR